MKAGHKTNIINIGIELDPDEMEALDSILIRCHRSRKSFAESLLKLAISSHKKGNSYITLSALGLIKL